MPKLIGMWRLPLPLARRRPQAPAFPDGVREMIRDVATDEDGQQWGLVVRISPVPGPGPGRLSRLDPVRWVRWNATPFVEEEIVTPNGWDGVEEPPR